jgi:hypothetical protein
MECYTHVVWVSLFTSHSFRKWEQFSQKASALQIDDDDIDEVDSAAREVIGLLENDSDLADAEVPKTIAFVRQFIAAPHSSSRRAVFAMIRTLETIVSSIFMYSVKFVNNTIEKTVDKGAIATSTAIGSLSISLASA